MPAGTTKHFCVLLCMHLLRSSMLALLQHWSRPPVVQKLGEEAARVGVQHMASAHMAPGRSAVLTAERTPRRPALLCRLLLQTRSLYQAARPMGPGDRPADGASVGKLEMRRAVHRIVAASLARASEAAQRPLHGQRGIADTLNFRMPVRTPGRTLVRAIRSLRMIVLRAVHNDAADRAMTFQAVQKISLTLQK